MQDRFGEMLSLSQMLSLSEMLSRRRSPIGECQSADTLSIIDVGTLPLWTCPSFLCILNAYRYASLLTWRTKLA